MKLIEVAIREIVERQRFLANLSPIKGNSTVGEVFGGDD